MEEYLDVLDAKGEKTGVSKSYEEVHRTGLLHGTVHVWFLNSKGQLLLQKRSKNKTAYPNRWDISAAGHISAGQTSVEAAQRETEEELGLNLPNDAFRFLFSVEEHIILNNGTYVNNEFQDVYLVHSDVSITELRFPEDEVEEMRWVNVAEFKQWISEGRKDIVPHSEEYSRLFKYIKQ